MPKTSLFETNVFVHVDEEYYDKYEFVKPGMTFRMNYTHTRNYESEKTITHVTVVFVRSVIDCCCTVSILGCVLKTEEPIYICVHNAALGEDIYLYDKDDKLVAKGGVHKFNDSGTKNF